MSVAQVSAQIEDIYGFEVIESMVSAITDKLLPEIEMWQKRPLSAVYPIVYVDGIKKILQIDVLHPHMFRYSHATVLHELGIDDKRSSSGRATPRRR